MTREELTREIMATTAGEKKFAERNNRTADLLSLLAIVSSFFTAMLAVNDHVDKSLLAVLGGLPGIITVIAGKMLYAKKSTWHAIYYFDLQRLTNELEFTEPSIVYKKYKALQENKRGERVTSLF